MKFKFIFLILLISSISRSQINTTSALVPTITNAGLGDLYRTSDTNLLYIGLSNGTLSLIGGSENNWGLNGNSNAKATSLLGTTNDRKVAVTSNNTSILELGKRSTLGLVTTDSYSNNGDQYMAYLKGNGVSALQFELPSTSQNKSMIFTKADGNFRMVGGAGRLDFFEIGSAGTDDDGSLEIVTGDNSTEPIIFKAYHYISKAYTELMRIQGLENPAKTANAGVRVGINTNGAVANSVLQVGGALSLPIRTVTASTTLTDNDYTVILKSGTYSGTAVTLPDASTCKGRIYIIKNLSGADRSISPFISRSSGISSTIIGGAGLFTTNTTIVFSLQSDGTDWQLVSDNY